MRISELSARSGVPVPTIKYYLREGLLPRGEVTSTTQAAYGEEHVRRLRLIRAMSEVGDLSLAGIRRVLDAVDKPDLPVHTLLGSLCWSLGPYAEPRDDEEWRTARETTDDLLTELNWQVYPEAPMRDTLAHAIFTLRRSGMEPPRDRLLAYADLARQAAELDIDQLDPSGTRTDLMHAAVLGSVLYDRIFQALRRLAQEDASARRYGRALPPGNGGDSGSGG